MNSSKDLSLNCWCIQGSWEAHATILANASSDQDLVQAYNRLGTELKVKAENPARVVFARDTRASGPHLVAALVEALSATGVEFTDYKILTTPLSQHQRHAIRIRGADGERILHKDCGGIQTGTKGPQGEWRCNGGLCQWRRWPEASRVAQVPAQVRRRWAGHNDCQRRCA